MQHVVSGRSTRQRIVDVATELFIIQGYRATSTRDIARRVGIKQPSLYAHFSVKADLLLEVLLQTLRPTLDHARELAADPILGPRERLAELVAFDVRLLCAGELNVGLLAYLPEVRAEGLADRLAEHQESVRQAYGGLIADVLEASDRPRDEAYRLAWLVHALVEGVILRRAHDPALDPEATAAEMAETALRLVG